MNIELILYLFLGISKESPNVGLRFTNVFVENLWTIDDFWLTSIQHVADLPSHQGLACSWRSVQKNTFDVLQAQLLNDLGWKYSRGKGSTEDGVEFVVQATNSHLLKIPVRIDD
jgi:hypothetical protein